MPKILISKMLKKAKVYFFKIFRLNKKKYQAHWLPIQSNLDLRLTSFLRVLAHISVQTLNRSPVLQVVCTSFLSQCGSAFEIMIGWLVSPRPRFTRRNNIWNTNKKYTVNVRPWSLILNKRIYPFGVLVSQNHGE